MGRMKPMYDGIRLNCTIVSDTHIDHKHPFPWLPPWRMKQVISDSEKSKAPVDVFLTVGDTTSRGSELNWQMTEECFKNRHPAKQVIFAIGNHDTWHDDGFEAAIENYRKYTEIICGKRRETPYFSEVINGYYFIFIGTDEDSGCEASLSEEQLQWFENEMNAAGKSGKPIFVFCHQSLNERHGLPRTWDVKEDYEHSWDGGIGESSERVEKILRSQKHVYYFSGHSHMGLGGEELFKKEGYASFEETDGLTLINLPSLACGNHHGEDKSFCLGLQLEAYDDRVVIRPRSFKLHTWNRKVKIKNGKPYWEDRI